MPEEGKGSEKAASVGHVVIGEVSGGVAGEREGGSGGWTARKGKKCRAGTK